MARLELAARHVEEELSIATVLAQTLSRLMVEAVVQEVPVNLHPVTLSHVLVRSNVLNK